MRPGGQDNFQIAVKTALLRRPLGKQSVSSLAEAIGVRRETASRAINRGEFPRVRARIAHELRLAAHE